MIRSLLRLADRTHTYIPISPYLLPIISSNISSTSRLKPSTLHPLDLEVQIRIPQQYLKTRVCAESLVEEASFILAEWLASKTVQGSIAFPEVVIPVIVLLRKALKSAKVLSTPKRGKSSGTSMEVGSVKTLVERVEETARWVELKRNAVTFAPGQTAQVEEWEAEMSVKIEGSPLSKYVKVLKTTREKRRMLVTKVCLLFTSFGESIPHPSSCFLRQQKVRMSF
jgi:nucleolar complex protein 2